MGQYKRSLLDLRRFLREKQKEKELLYKILETIDEYGLQDSDAIITLVKKSYNISTKEEVLRRVVNRVLGSRGIRKRFYHWVG